MMTARDYLELGQLLALLVAVTLVEWIEDFRR